RGACHRAPPVAQRAAARRALADPAHDRSLRTGERARQRGHGRRGGPVRPRPRPPPRDDLRVREGGLRRALHPADRPEPARVLRRLRERGAAQGAGGHGRQRLTLAVAILDVDGTLIDTNYQHALAWFGAFARHEIVLPIWRIHRHIGLGVDQVVSALTDERTERELDDEIRDAEKSLYGEMIGEVRAMEGSQSLIDELRERGHRVVLATSAKPEELDHYLDMLDARERADAWTSSEDVESTKPEPDLVHAALQKLDADPGDAMMIGDTPWDVEAAKRAGVATIAVRTGGFAAEELREAGALAVYESVAELRDSLAETPLG